MIARNSRLSGRVLNTESCTSSWKPLIVNDAHMPCRKHSATAAGHGSRPSDSTAAVPVQASSPR